MSSSSSSSHNWNLQDQVCLRPGLAAVRGSVFILYHPLAPSLERAVEEADAYLSMREHFDTMAVMIWLGQPLPPPAPEVRAALGAAFCAGPAVEAVAWIVEGDNSLVASIYHSIATQMFPRGCVSRMYQDPFVAASWLAGVAKDTDAEMVLEGLDALDRAQPA